jgi:hypothetical protein
MASGHSMYENFKLRDELKPREICLVVEQYKKDYSNENSTCMCRSRGCRWMYWGMCCTLLF